MASRYTSQTIIHPETEGVHPIINVITVHPQSVNQTPVQF